MQEFVPYDFKEWNGAIRYSFTQIDSTQDWSKRNLSAFDKTKINVVEADYQHAGHGRSNRPWLSPQSGNVYATLCCHCEKATPNLAQAMSVSIAHVLQELGFSPELKWPNDILIQGKKVGGAMCDFHGEWVLIGFGLNVNMSSDELKKVDRPATSLRVVQGSELFLDDIRDKIFRRLFYDWELFSRLGFKPFLSDYKKLSSSLIGKPIKFHHGRQEWEGVFKGIEENGSVRVLLNSGEERIFFSGEIS